MSAAVAPVLQVDGLVKHFPVSRGLIRRKVIGLVRAVEGVTFEIARGETLALVGESGCGKSTTGRLVLRLMDPTAGSVRFKGEEIANLDKNALRRLRRHMQIIFQDPYASLNPRMTVGEILAEPMAVHGLHTEAERESRVRELLDVVGLLPEHARRYPAPVLRRPAPADRHRPRACRQSRPDRLRRAGLRPRRLDPGADRQPAAEPAAPLRPLLPVHRPRPRRGEAHQRPRGGDVSRQAGRDRLQARPLRAAAAPLYPGAAGGDPAARSPACARSACCCRATCPAPSRRHRAAASIRAVPSPSARCREEEPVLREAGGGPNSGHRVACHFYETLPAPSIAAAAGPGEGKFAERLAAFEAAKQARGTA